MPVFYFPTIVDQVRRESAEGMVLPDSEAAWREATKTAGELLRDIDGSLKPGSEWAIEVQNEAHQTLRTIRIVTQCLMPDAGVPSA